MWNPQKNKKDKHLLHFYIIDSDTIFTNQLSRSLNSDPDYRISAFYDKKEFMERYCSELISNRKDQIHVIIIDSNQIPENKDFEQIQSIKENYKNTEIIVLTDEETPNYGSDALKSGVYAIIPKNDNIFYRVENSAKGIKSLKLFQRKRKNMKVALFSFIGFILLAGILFIFLLTFS